MSSFAGNKYNLCRASNSVEKTLRWWKERLSNPSVYRQLRPLGPLQDLGIFVDASTSWGIGIIIGQSWYAFALADGWKIPGSDICWLESIALELLVYFLQQSGVLNAHLLMHSDNNGAIGAHSKGHSRNYAINLCVLRTYAVTSALLIVPSFVYVESEQNPADPISRGELGLPHYKRLERRFELPDELAPYLVDAHG